MKHFTEPRSNRFRIAVRKYQPFETAIRAQWEAFEMKVHSGLTLDLVPLELPALEDALFTSKGMASGEWDTCFIPTDWIASMYAQKCAVDLLPLLENEPPNDYPEGWHPSLLRLQRIKETILGVPYHDGPECLIYRRDLFEDRDTRDKFRRRFDRKLTVPRTWAEFHTIARFFQDPRRHLYGAAFAAFPDRHNSIYDFLLQLWTRGGDLTTPSGDLLFSSTEAESALNFYRNILSDDLAVHPECRRLDSVAAGRHFAAGEIAMMINWFGFALLAHTSEDSVARGFVDVAKIPSNSGFRSISLNVYWILSIAIGSPHRELSWQFLCHTLTPAMDRLTTASGAIGCRRSTWNDAGINERIPFYRRIELLHDHAREIPQRDDWPKVAAIIDRLVTSAITTSEPTRYLLRAADESYAQL